MEAIKININGIDIYFQEKREILVQLLNDDEYLIDYVYRAALQGSLESKGITKADAHDGNLAIIKYTTNEQQFTAPPSTSENQLRNQFYSLSDSDSNNNKENETAEELDIFESQSVTVDSESISVISLSSTNSQEIKVWAPKKKPTTADREATKYLLKLRGNESYKNKFIDKKHNKNQLWGEICKKLNEKGFFVGQGSAGAERCRQKFANMQKMYIKFMYNQNKTGAGYIEPPEYYDELHGILGTKHKVTPTYLIGTMQEKTPTMTSNNPHVLDIPNETTAASSSTTKNITDSQTLTPMAGPSKKIISTVTETHESEMETEEIFINTETPKYKKTLKPQKMSEKILNTIVDIGGQNEKRTTDILKKQEEQTTMLKKYLDQQQDNQKQFLKLFGTLVDHIVKKKKRRHSSSEDD